MVEHLSKNKIYPEVLLASKKYRCEQFIDAATPSIENITPEQMKQIAIKLANIPKEFKALLKKSTEEHPSIPQINLNTIKTLYDKFEAIVKTCELEHP